MSSSRRPARVAVLLGALAVLAIPVGIVAAQFVNGLVLLKTLYAVVPASVVLGLLALLASRRARLAVARSLRPEAAGPVRLGRILAWAGLYVGITGALGLAVYGVLRWASA
jgi:hypothetical protein